MTKIFVVNKGYKIELEACFLINSDALACPAFASCCEYGDLCQIQNKELHNMGKTGFPEWCPLDDAPDINRKCRICGCTLKEFGYQNWPKDVCVDCA
jgi:hypothetical protein